MRRRRCGLCASCGDWKIGDARLACHRPDAAGWDIPVCLAGVPAFMAGQRRDRHAGDLHAAPAVAAGQSRRVALCRPGRCLCSFGNAQWHVEMKFPPGRFRDCADLLRFLGATCNDLEAPARAIAARDQGTVLHGACRLCRARCSPGCPAAARPVLPCSRMMKAAPAPRRR